MKTLNTWIAVLFAAGSALAGGTVVGTVRTKPKADEEKIVAKNAEQCGAKIHAQKFVVGSNGGVQWAVATLEGVPNAKPMAAAADLFYDNVDCKFTPHVMVAPKGGKLKVRNSDDMLHNSHFYMVEAGGKKKNLINLALPKKGQVIENDKVLRKEGLVSVECDAHAFMQGFIWVLPHAYGAVTGEDGGFRLADVPAGTHTLKVWHEALGEKTLKVTVEDGKEAKVAIDL